MFHASEARCKDAIAKKGYANKLRFIYVSGMSQSCFRKRFRSVSHQANRYNYLLINMI